MWWRKQKKFESALCASHMNINVKMSLLWNFLQSYFFCWQLTVDDRWSATAHSKTSHWLSANMDVKWILNLFVSGDHSSCQNWSQAVESSISGRCHKKNPCIILMYLSIRGWADVVLYACVTDHLLQWWLDTITLHCHYCPEVK